MNSVPDRSGTERGDFFPSTPMGNAMNLQPLNEGMTPREAFRTVTDHFCRSSFDAIPTLSVERAKDIVIDILGCMLSGHADPSSEVIRNLAASWGGTPESSMPGSPRKVPARSAAFANAVAARAFDFGVGGSSALSQKKPPVHISETLVPAALAVGEKNGASGKEVLVALVTGEDFAGRLAASLSFTAPLDCRGTVNTLGTAVTAGKLLGLSSKQFEHALFIAAHQVGGIKQGIQFNLGQGFSAMTGITAAELAQQGIQGVDDPVAEGKTLLNVFSSGFDGHTFLEGLGTVFHTSVSFKRYPCCRATHSSIECTLELLHEGLTADNVESVTIHVSPWTCAHLVGRPFALRANPHADAIFSLQYAVANALLRGDCLLEHYTLPFITSPDVMELTKRIRITSEGWPLHDGDPKLSSFLDVETRDGKHLQAYSRFPRGHELIGTPLTEEEKKEKFMRNMAFSACVSAEKAEALYRTLKHLDELDDLSCITDLLAL